MKNTILDYKSSGRDGEMELIVSGDYAERYFQKIGADLVAATEKLEQRMAEQAYAAAVEAKDREGRS